MGVLGGPVADMLLARLGQCENNPRMDGRAYRGRSKLEVLLGTELWDRIAGRTVLDFGCGPGLEAVELAQRGARRVIGLDIQEPMLEQARRHARSSGEHERCTFTSTAPERADVIIAIDSFEHFSDPGGVLRQMADLLAPGGSVLVSFGPTWYHPLGGHLFSIFPWAHLVFTERALIRWRSTFKRDGATRFSQVAGGLNRMTIRRFVRLVEESPLRFAELETRPIRQLRWLHNRATREFTTATVRCRLERRTSNDI
jgi:SAM-dependent methyltransferase